MQAISSRLAKLERGRKEPEEISMWWPTEDESEDPLLRCSTTGEEKRLSEIKADGEKFIQLKWPEDEK